MQLIGGRLLAWVGLTRWFQQSGVYYAQPGRCTVVTEVGFRFLYFVFSARTGAGKALYYIGSSVLQGRYMELKKWRNYKLRYTCLYLSVLHTF